MFSRIREKLGLAYSVFSGSENYSNRGYVMTYAGVAHENAEKVVRATLEEYARIRDQIIPAQELKRTKDFIKGRMLMALETSNAVASFVGGEEMLTAKPMTPDEVFAKLEAVTADDVGSAAKELFSPERLNLAVLGPAPEPEKFRAILDGFN